MLALLSANASADDCHIQRVASLPITFNGFVPTVPAHINRQLVYIGVDTGSSTTVLTPENAARLNLPRVNTRHVRTFIGSNWTVAYQVLLESFEFGGATQMMKSVPVIALGGAHQAPVSGANAEAPLPDAAMAGLVGTEILSYYELEFRFPALLLNLYLVGTC